MTGRVRATIAVPAAAMLIVLGCTGGSPSPAPLASAPALRASAVAGSSLAAPSASAGAASGASPSASTGSTIPGSLPASAQPPTGCVVPPPDLASIVRLDSRARLACFGGASLTFDATIAKPISDCGIGPRLEPAWFCLPGVFLAIPTPSTDSTVQPLAAYWDPASGLRPTSFPAGPTVRITGHFDDPAALTCHSTEGASGQGGPSAGDVILSCRETFVVTQVR